QATRSKFCSKGIKDMAITKAPSKGISFPPRLGADGRVAWSEGPENIRESIRVILSTEPGERLMLPEFGGGLRRFLFEPNTASTRRLIEERVTQALAVWEPRIRLEGVLAEADPADARIVHVTIRYRLVTDGRRESA